MKNTLRKILNRLRQLSQFSNPALIRFRLHCAYYWVKNEFAMRHYRRLNKDELISSRKSDTVFIFGSGYSLNEIPDSEWREMARHDTIGFNWFVHQNFIRVDYHLFREISTSDLDPAVWKPAIVQYANLIKGNHHYENTIFAVQGEFRALNGNRLISMHLLPRGNKVYRFRTKSRSIYQPPTKSIREGLVHGSGTLVSVVNLAYCLGWKNIVLVGVDLYDKRYFWLDKEETRIGYNNQKVDHNLPHNTTDRTIPFMSQWRELMEHEGIRLSVYNPKSLLADVMPVYDKHAAGKNNTAG